MPNLSHLHCCDHPNILSRVQIVAFSFLNLRFFIASLKMLIINLFVISDLKLLGVSSVVG